MTDCEWISFDPFLTEKMAAMPATLEIIKSRFCRKDYSSCARYQVMKALGKEKVPVDLSPNNKDRARDLIAETPKNA